MKLFTGDTDVKLTDENLAYFMTAVARTAGNFAKRRFRSRDQQFVDECVAEAYFWLVVIFDEFKEELSKSENPEAYVKSKVGYKLLEYWAPYATSTLSYLKKNGKQVPLLDVLSEEDLARQDTEIECFLCLQSVMKTQLDWDVYEQHLLNKTPREIATALNTRLRKVQKVLARIKKRLKSLQNADVSPCPGV